MIKRRRNRMKSWKKRLAVILSAAMVMTAGTGMPGYGRSSAVSLKTALASVRTEEIAAEL